MKKQAFGGNKILFFLFGIGFAIKLNIVGSISLSELFLIVAAPFYVFKINWKDKELFTVLTLYASLFLFQLISELVVENSFVSAVKGLAITVVSFLHFSFLYRYLRKDLSLLPVLVISLAFSQLITGPEEILKGAQFSVEDLTENIGSKLLKFYLAPIIINILLFFSLATRWRKFAFVLLAVGIVFILLGARSSGLILFLTGLIALAIEISPRWFTSWNLLKGFSVIALIGYSLYCLYASLVLTGKIDTGNSAQLLRCDNPYNPFELVLRGRAETWVGWQAFMDRFFFGHGAWAHDYSGYYLRMLSKVQQLNGTSVIVGEDTYLIPAHSVIVGIGTSNGFFAFLAMAILICFFVKRGLTSLSKIPSKYRIVFLSFLSSLMWNAMFSPAAHFRQTLPIYCAGIFVLYRIYAKRKKIRALVQALIDERKTE